eukprot:CAMPEP_0179311466 /NCGR_PEP_ID=MMETSP0797-20121207/52700_1 /TAXON_ID=47934 /ORGANISM="Dinophysis acuminata, Strain DAEP01" /LENGTH=220 /DNA_ID=CAMNT_0021021239 /DNA_START=48 /DNA_END=711 /DNA_ORIENTATION=-
MFSCHSICAPRDVTADTVKVSLPLLISDLVEGDAPYMAAKEEEVCVPEGEEARQLEHLRHAQQAAERLHLQEEMWRDAEEWMRRVRGEAGAREAGARQQPCEPEEAPESARSRNHEREEAERADLAEAAQALERRKGLVGAFLAEHGYSGPAASRRTMTKTKYPIHTAAKVGNPEVILALLEEGADPTQKDSAGRTALQVAQRRDRKGSHADVLHALGGI